MRIACAVVLFVACYRTVSGVIDEESGLRGSPDAFEATDGNSRGLNEPIDDTTTIVSTPTDPLDDVLSSSPRTKGHAPFGRCKGECDTDEDCIGDLVCLQRVGNPKVYGCKGTPERGVDYCVDPPKGEPLPLEWCGEEPPNKIGRCQGDCDVNKDCMPGLYCFKRKKGSLSSIPGCIGEGVPGMDYCVAIDDPPTDSYPACPETSAPTPASTDEPTPPSPGDPRPKPDPTPEPTQPSTSSPTPLATEPPTSSPTHPPTPPPGDPRPRPDLKRPTRPPRRPPARKPTSHSNPCSVCYTKLAQTGISRHYLHKALVYFKYMCEKCTTKSCVHYKFKLLEKLRYSTRRHKRCSGRQNHVWHWCNREAAKYKSQRCP